MMRYIAPDMMPSTPPVERPEILKLLYPWYKEEVFRRRQQMIWLTVLGAMAFILLLFLVAALPPARPAHRAWTFLAYTAVVIFSGSMIAFILQQWNRHRMAKQILIAIEQGLGLYGDAPGAGDALYPKEWQRAWLDDRSLWTYLAVIVALTALVILALMFR
jgi:hypothetical protein